MGTTVSHFIRPSGFHRGRRKRSKATIVCERKVITKVGSVYIFDEDLQSSVNANLPPIWFSLAGSICASDNTATVTLPVTASSQPISRNDGESALEKQVSDWGPVTVQATGDQGLENYHSVEALFSKIVRPITYRLMLRILESSLARVMFLELYGLDMKSLNEDQFTDWAHLANLPKTAQMYAQFQQDSSAFVVRHPLTTLENRFDVRVTMGDYHPTSADSDTEGYTGLLGMTAGVRELLIYGESPSKITSAANYLWATLSQVKMDQLLLPDQTFYSVLEEKDLKQWITILTPETPEPLLMRLRRRAIRDMRARSQSVPY